jgi:hypothetical protein
VGIGDLSWDCGWGVFIGREGLNFAGLGARCEIVNAGSIRGMVGVETLDPDRMAAME